MKTIVPFLILVAALLSGGCVREDIENCAPADEGLRLDFTFTNNKQGENLLTQNVRDIRVYIFDQSNDLLFDVIDVDPRDILNGGIFVGIPDGIYTIVAWASNSEDMMRDGFYAAYADDIDDDGEDEYIDISKEVTSLNTFRMMLAYDSLPDGVEGDVTPRVERFEDLYYASGSDLVVDHTQRQTLSFDFTRNTSTFDVRVDGLQYLSGASRAAADLPLDVFVIGSNGIYESNNQADTAAQRMRYNPYDGVAGADTLESQIKSLRLSMDDDCDVLLYLQDPDDRHNVIAPLNLMNVILATCDGAGNTIYKTQKDIDLEDEFVIDISFTVDLTVNVSVNGFEPIELTPEVTPPGETPNSKNVR